MRDVEFYEPIPILQVAKDQSPNATKPITVPSTLTVPSTSGSGITPDKMEVRTVNTRMLAMDRAFVRYMHHSSNNLAMVAIPIRSLDNKMRKFNGNGVINSTTKEDKSNGSIKAEDGKVEDEITQNESNSDKGCEVEFELDIILPDSIDGLSSIEVRAFTLLTFTCKYICILTCMLRVCSVCESINLYCTVQTGPYALITSL